MSLLVVGSVAYDAVETPFGKCEKMLGGSASHFSISASFFTNVSIVGVVGGDFTDGEVFEKHRGQSHLPSCEAAAVVKPKARLCEPWVTSKQILREPRSGDQSMGESR